VLFGGELGLGLKVPEAGGDLAPTSVHAAIAAREKKLSLLELKRVLYVAFTRAKDYLILSAAGGKVTTGKDFTALSTWLSWLGKVYGFGDLAALPGRLAAGKAALLVNPCAIEGAGARQEAAACQEAATQAGSVSACWLEGLAARIAPLPAVRAETVFNASDVGRFRRCPRSYFYGAVAALPEPPVEPVFRTGGAKPPGRIIGDILHRCLELAVPGRETEEILAQAADEKAPLRWREAAVAEVRPLLVRYCGGELHKETDGRPVRREWRFAFHLPAPENGTAYTFTGRVDCLVDYQDGSFGIVDYKTDKVAAGETAAKAGEYALQLVLYALAAETAGLGRARDARLHFLRPGMTATVPLDAAARAAATAELLAVCRHVVGHGDEREYPANTAWCPHCGYRVLCGAYKP
jgi:ATP-dependent helicase/nuclease subunit A